jgi:hypothetical protein
LHGNTVARECGRRFRGNGCKSMIKLAQIYFRVLLSPDGGPAEAVGTNVYAAGLNEGSAWLREVPRTARRSSAVLQSRGSPRVSINDGRPPGYYDLMAVTGALLSVAEFARLPQPPGGVRQELHHGELVESPPVKKLHTKLQRRLVSLLEARLNPAEQGIDKEFPSVQLRNTRSGLRTSRSSVLRCGVRPRTTTTSAAFRKS